MKRWLVCVGALVVGLVVLHRLGGGGLQTPPLGSTDELRVWFDERDGTVAAMAVLRLVAIAAGWWLLALAVLDAVARTAKVHLLRRLSDRLTPAAFRELLGTGAGAGMASLAALGVMAPPPPTGEPAAAAPPDAIVMRQLPAEDPTTTTTMTVVPEPTTTITMSVIAEPVVTAAHDPAPPEPAPAPAPTSAPGPTDDTTWVVEPGESFWAIAVEHLADELGRPPTDREIISYWTALIEANRAELPDPNNPDLLFAGHVLALPAI